MRNRLRGDRLFAIRLLSGALLVLFSPLAAAFPVDPAATLQLIDDNLLRMRGVTPSGRRVGFSSHPEYGEIGRIRANLDLFEAARAADTGGAPRW